MQRTLVVVVATVLSVTAALAESPEKKALADRIHAFVMERSAEYRRTHRTKAMVICIQWVSPTPPRIKIEGVFATRTGIGSDGPIFTPDLRRNAMRRCKAWAKKEGADCTCQRLDEDGKNVLRVP